MKIRAMVFVENLFLRSKLNELLSRWGYEIVAFSNPADCMLLHSNTCHYACTDILICDLPMPNVTMFQAIEKNLRTGCRIRNVALLSEDWSPEEVAHARKLSCKLFKKPLHFGELGLWLDECENRINPQRLLSDELLQAKAPQSSTFL